MRRLCLAFAFVIAVLPLALQAQTSTRRARQERSVLVTSDKYEANRERAGQSGDSGPQQVPLLARQPELEPTPAFESRPEPPLLPADDISTRRPRPPQVQGRDLNPPPAPEAEASTEMPREPGPQVAESPAAEPAPMPPTPARLAAKPEPEPQLPALDDDQMMLSTAGAGLRVDAMGPRSISIGKTADYRVRLMNLTDVDGQDVVVRVELPPWVDVIGGRPTIGDAQRVADADGEGTRLTWTVPRIAARGQEFLELQLVPRESTPFDVKVEWVSRPRSAAARVIVQQPQLALQVVGPQDVLYGSTAKYLIHIANPGNGDAENVTLHVSSGDGVQSKQFPRIAAGAREAVELELVAREAGELVIEAAAIADGDLSAEQALPVRIRRAKLEMTVTGPSQRFAGQEGLYRVEIANVGDAAATNMIAQVALPAGAEYLGGIQAAAASNGRLEWRLPDLAPEGRQSYQFQCSLPVPGQQRVTAQAASNGQLMAHAVTVTNVEAIADLKLSIDDPRGPVPTGKSVAYEIKVVNRGSRAAENVKVIAQFSNGIEPASFAGHSGKLLPGQVVFDPIPALGGGQTAVLKIIAKAEAPGTHRFRTTVTCSDQDAQHIAEETTRYFQGLSGEAPAAKPAAPAYETSRLEAGSPIRDYGQPSAPAAPATPLGPAPAAPATPLGPAPADAAPVPLETTPIAEPSPLGNP